MRRDLPPGLLEQAGLVAVERLPARETCMWLVDWPGTLGVLRRLDPAPVWAADADLAADAGWLHSFLSRLACHDFPAPRPLPVFGQQSWAVTDAGVWEVVSFVPGDLAGASRVPMEALVALLACYHAAAGQVRVTRQRPIALPLAQVPAVLAPAWPRTAGEDEQVRLVRHLAGELAADLDRIGHGRWPRLVTHGDFTNHNVLAAGQPSRPCGVIDFALAHLESPLADIGYGLWRSGRPYDEATWLDMPRVQRFVHGYPSVRSLSGDDVAAIEKFVRGRGLQMLAKRALSGRRDLSPLRQAHWLSTHRQLSRWSRRPRAFSRSRGTRRSRTSSAPDWPACRSPTR